MITTIQNRIDELTARRAHTCGFNKRARITEKIEELEKQKMIIEHGCYAANIESLPRGEFFKRKPDAKKVYQRAEYDRSARKYWGMDETDISRGMLFKTGTVVYIGFDY